MIVPSKNITPQQLGRFLEGGRQKIDVNFCFRATRPERCVVGTPYIVIIHNVHKITFCLRILFKAPPRDRNYRAPNCLPRTAE